MAFCSMVRITRSLLRQKLKPCLDGPREIDLSVVKNHISHLQYNTLLEKRPKLMLIFGAKIQITLKTNRSSPVTRNVVN